VAEGPLCPDCGVPAWMSGWTTTGRSNLGDLPYQRRTLAAQGLLAGLCLLLCILAALGLAVPSWAAWAATAATNGLVALEKWRLVREDRP
jgi:hypothetical protein